MFGANRSLYPKLTKIRSEVIVYIDLALLHFHVDIIKKSPPSQPDIIHLLCCRPASSNSMQNVGLNSSPAVETNL